MTSTPVVEFVEDDPFGLWKAGELAYDLGWESPGVPIRVLRTHEHYELITLTSPYERGLIKPAALEFGIIWDSHRESSSRVNTSTDKRLTPMGMTIFESVEAREEAMAVLRSLGYTYMTTYRDVHGPGLSWSERCGPMLRPSASKRLPSHQRAIAWDRNRPNLYRNPGYDLVNDPDPRYFGDY